MASVINVDGLTLSPEEMGEFKEFIYEKTYNRPELRMIHDVQGDIKMKDQIVFAGLLGLMGLKGDSSCDRKNSGASATLTQKYWEPQGIEDTLIQCNKELSALFKAYFTRIAAYKERYEIEGSDLKVFLMIVIEDAITTLIWRASWFADSAVAVYASGTEGLLVAGSIPSFNYFDGLFKQIDTAVTAGDVARYTVAENALTDPAAQTAITTARAVEILKNVTNNADSRLRQDPNRKFLVTRAIWDAYEEYLTSQGVDSKVDYTMEGFSIIKYKGAEVVNMENVWSTNIAYFGADSDEVGMLARPNRVVLTTKANIPLGTLNENDISDVEFIYDNIERKNYIGFGFDLDAKLLEDYMISVAY